MTHTYDTIILGAGASGLMAAYTASLAGKKVVIIDHANRSGRKVRIAGGGKANFANTVISAQHFFGHNPKFVNPALKKFQLDALLLLLKKANIQWEEREFGQLFCLSDADKLVDYLEQQCRANGCNFYFQQSTCAVGAQNSRYHVRGSTMEALGNSLLIATGSPAWPQIGATVFGANLAKRFGHKLHQYSPVLVPLMAPDSWPLKELSGIAIPVTISPSISKEIMPLLFTHKGISGPASLMASCHWEKGQELTIDFLPHLSIKEMLDEPLWAKQKPLSLVNKHMPQRLAEALFPKTVENKKIAELSRKDRIALDAAYHTYTFTPMSNQGLRKAEAAKGGVDTDQINPHTMESTIKEKLFFAGEVMDITGMLGGYNLYWAFASGFVAGQNL